MFLAVTFFPSTNTVFGPIQDPCPFEGGDLVLLEKKTHALGHLVHHRAAFLLHAFVLKAGGVGFDPHFFQGMDAMKVSA
jgi:hypothetical protein